MSLSLVLFPITHAANFLLLLVLPLTQSPECYETTSFCSFPAQMFILQSTASTSFVFGIFHPPNAPSHCKENGENSLLWLDMTQWPSVVLGLKDDTAPASHRWGIWWHSDCVRSIRIPVMCLDRFPNCHTNILKVIYSCVRSDMSKAHCRKWQESIVQHVCGTRGVTFNPLLSQ